MACETYNCDDEFGTQTLVDCNTAYTGGIKNIILLLCGHTVTDASDGVQINANIDSGKAVLIKNIKANLPDPSPRTATPPIACQPDTVTTYDRTLVVVDGNVNQANNAAYIDPIVSGASFDSVIVDECEADRVTWLRPDGSGSFTGQGGRVIPESNGEFQVYNLTLAWTSRTEGEITNRPSNVF